MEKLRENYRNLERFYAEDMNKMTHIINSLADNAQVFISPTNNEKIVGEIDADIKIGDVVIDDGSVNPDQKGFIYKVENIEYVELNDWIKCEFSSLTPDDDAVMCAKYTPDGTYYAMNTEVMPNLKQENGILVTVENVEGVETITDGVTDDIIVNIKPSLEQKGTYNIWKKEIEGEAPRWLSVRNNTTNGVSFCDDETITDRSRDLQVKLIVTDATAHTVTEIVINGEAEAWLSFKPSEGYFKSKDKINDSDVKKTDFCFFAKKSRIVTVVTLSTLNDGSGGGGSAEGHVYNAEKHSLAEGRYTIATGYDSHAEGYGIWCKLKNIGYGSNYIELQLLDHTAESLSDNDMKYENCNTLFKEYNFFTNLGYTIEFPLEPDNEINNVYFDKGQYPAYTMKISFSNDFNGSDIWWQQDYIDVILRNRAENNGSHSEGKGTFAKGRNTHAEGLVTVASDDNAHAEGHMTTASNKNAHAEGLRTTASHKNAHAEGYGTIANGNTSHAEGYMTEASGAYSHAEGGASGKYSFISASGSGSHSAGYTVGEDSYIKANSAGSHAEGYTKGNNSFIIASGGGSHSAGYTVGQGSYIEASGEYRSHAEGCTEGQGSYIKASSAGSHAEGYTSGVNSYILSSGSGSIAHGETSGEYSHIEASNSGAHAEGYVGGDNSYINAGGDGAHAEGCAGGEYSYIEANSAGSHAEGYVGGDNSYINAGGDGAHAEGYVNGSNKYILAQGTGSHAEGQYTFAYGDASHAEGYGEYDGGNAYKKLSGKFTFTRESSTVTTTNISEINVGMILVDLSRNLDPMKVISVDNSNDTFVVDEVIGYNIQNKELYKANSGAIGYISHSEGEATIAYGYVSHAEGYLTEASGNYSHAEGESAKASGEASHAEGYNTETSGEASHAEGFLTEASGDYTHAEGRRTQAINGVYGEHAEGVLNISHENTISSIGCGYLSSVGGIVRRNAFEVLSEGDVYIKGIGGYTGQNDPNSSDVKSLQAYITSLEERIRQLENNQ